jgi:hypothetical protein
MPPGAVIEVGGGLVGEDDIRLGDQGAGDGHALALAAAQLVGAVTGELGQLHHFEKMHDALPALGLAELVHLQQRVLDVLRRGEHRKEIKGLKHKADIARAQDGELVGGRPPMSWPATFRLPRVACRCNR